MNLATRQHIGASVTSDLVAGREIDWLMAASSGVVGGALGFALPGAQFGRTRNAALARAAHQRVVSKAAMRMYPTLRGQKIALTRTANRLTHATRELNRQSIRSILIWSWVSPVVDLGDALTRRLLGRG